jgi:hypothetical protein
MAHVFHANTEVVREAGRSAFHGEAEWPSEYTLAAIVDTDSVEEAYGLTNHVDREWWDNPGVELVGPKTRSTSTGDVVVVNGQGYKCESFGWSEPFEVSTSDMVRASKLR